MNAPDKHNGTTLTLTLSRPTGEGTAVGCFGFFRNPCSQYRTPIRGKYSGRFSLSHRMGEGRGEGGFGTVLQAFAPLLLVVLLFCSLSALSAPTPPTDKPSVTQLEPRGIQRGVELKIKL